MKIEELSDEVLLKHLDRIDFAINALRLIKVYGFKSSVEDLDILTSNIQVGIDVLQQLGGTYTGHALDQLIVLCSELEEEANKRGLLDEDK